MKWNQLWRISILADFRWGISFHAIVVFDKKLLSKSVLGHSEHEAFNFACNYQINPLVNLRKMNTIYIYMYCGWVGWNCPCGQKVGGT